MRLPNGKRSVLEIGVFTHYVEKTCVYTSNVVVRLRDAKGSGAFTHCTVKRWFKQIHKRNTFTHNI